jgi:hypothetical protein
MGSGSLVVVWKLSLEFGGIDNSWIRIGMGVDLDLVLMPLGNNF